MTEAEIDTYVTVVSDALGLPIDAAHRPGVVRYFGLARQMVAILESYPLDPYDESGEGYQPVVMPAATPIMQPFAQQSGRHAVVPAAAQAREAGAAQ